MVRSFMSNEQVPATEWVLPRGQAQRLPASTRRRELRVVEGRVWATRAGEPQDWWLAAGERLALPAGAELVVEGWPQARFELLEAAPPLSAGASGLAGPKRAARLLLPPRSGALAPRSPCAT